MIRIAMWSGPRNISTALMRSFENRDDCVVVDEPLYAHYLAVTGLDHPAAEQVIAAGDTDWRRVTEWLSTGTPGGADPTAAICYQKHMTHHLLPHITYDWIHRLRNVLLIRDPREVVASYVKSRATVTPKDIGLPQQVALYEALAPVGGPPPVIDAADFLRDPEGHLRALCDLFEVPFTDRMLSWPAGPRDSDGVWAPYWYEAVRRSTGFEPYRPRNPRLDGEPARTAQACLPHYGRLRAVRLRP
ncbi:MAG TPA: HAD family hydrolase [Micromonosporaceae bacterium]